MLLRERAPAAQLRNQRRSARTQLAQLVEPFRIKAHLLDPVDEENRCKRTHHHDAFQRDIHNAAALGKHAAQRHDEQRDGEKHHLPEHEIHHIHGVAHFGSPPSSLRDCRASSHLPKSRLNKSENALK